jgi:hypothetical protein
MTICKLRVYRQPYRRFLLCVSIREGEKLVLTNNLFILSPSANRRHLRYFPPFVFHFRFHWKTEIAIFIQTIKWKDKSTYMSSRRYLTVGIYLCSGFSLILGYLKLNFSEKDENKSDSATTAPWFCSVPVSISSGKQTKQQKKWIQDPVVLCRKNKKKKKEKKERWRMTKIRELEILFGISGKPVAIISQEYKT